ncbi:MAG: hypothetical protein GY850_19965 [bacterium]|nr:hypothetical protein [bacterium]
MTFVVTVFIVVYLGMMMGRLPGLKVDRSAIALLGAIALLAGGGMSEQQAVNSIGYGTIGLLFGLMIVSAQLTMSGLYAEITHRIVLLNVGPRVLLAMITAVSGVLAALLTNDVIALAMAPVLLQSMTTVLLTGFEAFGNTPMDAVVTGTGNDTFFGRTAKLVATAGATSHSQQAVLQIGNFLILALSKKQAIVSRLAAIEEMAGVDILCSDKTGTLTQNKLTLGDPIVFGDSDKNMCILGGALASRKESGDAIGLAVIGGLKDPLLLEENSTGVKSSFLTHIAR